MMKYKIITAARPEKLEEKVATWMEEEKVKDILHSDTKFAIVPVKDGRRLPLFTLGLWYKG